MVPHQTAYVLVASLQFFLVELLFTASGVSFRIDTVHGGLSDPFSLGAVQHEFTSSSPAPSVSDSETGSEHSHSSSSSDILDAENLPLPQIYVQLDPKSLTADLMKNLYESHAQDGLLGLYLAESRISEGAHWCAKRWNQVQTPRDDADILLIFS
ncbi:hypothetical protein MPER_00857, partial [Moniliophthora perniciosa FA553]